MANFYRIGAGIVIPVGPATQNDQVPVQVPAGANAFILINPNRFLCSLRGTTLEQFSKGAFNVTSLQTGWTILPGVMGPFGTLKPAAVSAMSLDNPALGSEGVAGTGYMILQYGVGGSQ